MSGDLCLNLNTATRAVCLCALFPVNGGITTPPHREVMGTEWGAIVTCAENCLVCRIAVHVLLK